MALAAHASASEQDVREHALQLRAMARAALLAVLGEDVYKRQACGQPVEMRIPPGDNLPRAVCTACGTVHYENPRIVVGCVPEWQGLSLIHIFAGR